MATGLSRALEQVANDLMNQYTIVYDGASGPATRASSACPVKRRGITLRAPSRIPGDRARRPSCAFDMLDRLREVVLN